MAKLIGFSRISEGNGRSMIQTAAELAYSKAVLRFYSEPNPKEMTTEEIVDNFRKALELLFTAV